MGITGLIKEKLPKHNASVGCDVHLPIVTIFYQLNLTKSGESRAKDVEATLTGTVTNSHRKHALVCDDCVFYIFIRINLEVYHV